MFYHILWIFPKLTEVLFPFHFFPRVSFFLRFFYFGHIPFQHFLDLFYLIFRFCFLILLLFLFPCLFSLFHIVGVFFSSPRKTNSSENQFSLFFHQIVPPPPVRKLSVAILLFHTVHPSKAFFDIFQKPPPPLTGLVTPKTHLSHRLFTMNN